MEEPSLHGVRSNGDSGNTTRPAGGLATSEDANVDDPPPIPNASASRYLTNESVGVSRFNEEPYPFNENDPEDIHNTAHALVIEDVTRILATDPTAGLATPESIARRERYGSNKLETSSKIFQT